MKTIMRINFNLDLDLKNDLSHMAVFLRRTKTSLLEEAIQDVLLKYKEAK